MSTVNPRDLRPTNLTTGLAPGQWVERKPAKPVPTLGRRLVDAINKGRKLDEVSAEVENADLSDLNDHAISVLMGRLDREISEREDLRRALEGVLAARKGGSDGEVTAR